VWGVQFLGVPRFFRKETLVIWPMLGGTKAPGLGMYLTEERWLLASGRKRVGGGQTCQCVFWRGAAG